MNNEKLIEELKAAFNKHRTPPSEMNDRYNMGWDDCQSYIENIVSRHDKPAQGEKGECGLKEFVTRLVERAKHLGQDRIDAKVSTFEKALTMYPCLVPIQESEPLAVLADRKGYWKTRFTTSRDAMAEQYWTCEIEKTSFDIRVDTQRTFDFVGKTYAEAESKARQYLNGLPDKEV